MQETSSLSIFSHFAFLNCQYRHTNCVK